MTRHPVSARLQLLAVLLTFLAKGSGLKLLLPSSPDDPGPPQPGPRLAPGQVHSWQLDTAVSKCRGAVVVELWEDVATAQPAAPYMPKTFLCPLVTTKSYTALTADTQGLWRYYRNWFNNAHNSTQASNVQAASGSMLHWDAGACSRQLPYHRVILNASPVAVRASTWWLLVVNTRVTAVPSYLVRLTCAQQAPQHCPQPDPAGKPCSGAGVCRVQKLAYASEPNIFKVAVPQCVCNKGRTGIGCESELKELAPSSQWVRPQPTYDPHMKLVADAALNTPWSVVQIQLPPDVADKDPSPTSSWYLTIELEADWSGVVDINQVGNLSRPRLCIAGDTALVNNRLDPLYMQCRKVLSFPFRPRVAASDFLFSLKDYVVPRAVYVAVMDVGTAPTLLRARLGSSESHSLCPFDCSGQSKAACGDYGMCSCTGMSSDSDWCDLETNSWTFGVYPTVFPKQKTWVAFLSSRNITSGALRSKKWATLKTIVLGPRTTADVYATGYWVRQPEEFPEYLRLNSASLNTYTMAATNITTNDGPRPEVVCITPERLLNGFQPTCSKVASTEDGALALILMLRGGNGLGSGSVELQLTLEEQRTLEEQLAPGELHVKKKLSVAVIVGVTVSVTVAVAALVFAAWRFRKQLRDWSTWRPWTACTTASAAPLPTPVTMAASPPQVSVAVPASKGLPVAMLEMLPTRVFSGAPNKIQQPPCSGEADVCIVVDNSCAAEPEGNIASQDVGDKTATTAGSPTPATAAAQDTARFQTGAAAQPVAISGSSSPTSSGLEADAAAGTDTSDAAAPAAPAAPTQGDTAQQGNPASGAPAAPKAAAARQGEDVAPQASLENMCTICLAEYLQGDVLRHLPCLHTFHKGCIDAWLAASHTCPACRLDLLQMAGGNAVLPQP